MQTRAFHTQPQVRSESELVDLFRFAGGWSNNFLAAHKEAKKMFPLPRQRQLADGVAAIAAFLIELRRWPTRPLPSLPLPTRPLPPLARSIAYYALPR